LVLVSAEVIITDFHVKPKAGAARLEADPLQIAEVENENEDEEDEEEEGRRTKVCCYF